MKTFLAVGLLTAVAGLSWAAAPANFQRGPKNLMSPTYQAPPAQPAAAHELTRREVKRLTATAELPAEHLKLARYYASKADKLEANGVAFAKAAATYRNAPAIKNLMAPTTPARYDFMANGFREGAKVNRALAVSHEEMAKRASVRL